MTKSCPIKDKRAKVLFTLVGLGFIGVGIFWDRIRITLDGDPITNYIFLSIVFVGVILSYTQVGLKKLTPISNLKKLSNQQLFSVGSTTIVLIFAILNIFDIVDNFSVLASGLVMAEGVLLLLEVYR